MPGRQVGAATCIFVRNYGMRLVLLENEHRAAETHRRALLHVRPEWQIVLVSSSAEALAALADAPTDVLVAELIAPATDGLALFDEARERWPGTVRIGIAGFTDRSIALRLERAVHRLMQTPCDPYMLAMMAERSILLRDLVHDPLVTAAIGGMGALPRPPVTIQALEKVLADPDAGVIAVAAVISRDAALAARILRLVNSSFFGAGRQVTRIDAAVNFIGVSLVRALAFADCAARAFTVSPDVLDLDEWNLHAIRVAACSRDITRAMCPQDRALADDAFLAGLLHDVGQVVLAGVIPRHWADCERAAKATGEPICTIESRDGGVSHAIAGAYLLSLWGLPATIVEAVAFHHRPDRIAAGLFDPALAVHIADAITVRSPDRLAPAIDEATCSAAGVTRDQLTAWQLRYGAMEAAG